MNPDKMITPFKFESRESCSKLQLFILYTIWKILIKAFPFFSKYGPISQPFEDQYKGIRTEVNDEGTVSGD